MLEHGQEYGEGRASGIRVSILVLEEKIFVAKIVRASRRGRTRMNVDGEHKRGGVRGTPKGSVGRRRTSLWETEEKSVAPRGYKNRILAAAPRL